MPTHKNKSIFKFAVLGLWATSAYVFIFNKDSNDLYDAIPEELHIQRQELSDQIAKVSFLEIRDLLLDDCEKTEVLMFRSALIGVVTSYRDSLRDFSPLILDDSLIGLGCNASTRVQISAWRHKTRMLFEEGYTQWIREASPHIAAWTEEEEA